MQFQVPIFLIWFIIFVLWVNYKLKKSQKKDTSFWDRESQSNTVRKKSIESLNYITVSENSLPFFSTDDKNIRELETRVLELSKEKIVNLTGYTNTDLKLEYGPGNLDVLSSYDQNFTLLVRTLYSWASALEELGLRKEAIQVLEFGVECRSDIKAHYILLAKLYIQENTSEKINNLIAVANELNSLTKSSLIDELTKLMH